MTTGVTVTVTVAGGMTVPVGMMTPVGSVTVTVMVVAPGGNAIIGVQENVPAAVATVTQTVVPPAVMVTVEPAGAVPVIGPVPGIVVPAIGATMTGGSTPVTGGVTTGGVTGGTTGGTGGVTGGTGGVTGGTTGAAATVTITVVGAGSTVPTGRTPVGSVTVAVSVVAPGASGAVGVQENVPAAVATTAQTVVPPEVRVTVAPAGAVPVIGAVPRIGAPPATGVVMTTGATAVTAGPTVKVATTGVGSAVPAGRTPVGSVTVAVSVFTPVGSGRVGVQENVPAAVATTAQMLTPAGPVMVTVAPAGAVPVMVGRAAVPVAFVSGDVMVRPATALGRTTVGVFVPDGVAAAAMGTPSPVSAPSPVPRHVNAAAAATDRRRGLLFISAPLWVTRSVVRTRGVVLAGQCKHRFSISRAVAGRCTPSRPHT